MAVSVAATLAGCGPHQTEEGGPPFETPTPTSHSSTLRTAFPAEKLRFTLPAMAGDQKAAARTYIEFQRAYQRTLGTHRVTADLRRTTEPTLLAQIRQQLANTGATGLVRTHVKVDTIAIAQVGVGLRLCVIASGRRSPVAVLMRYDDRGDLKVAAFAKDPKRSHC
jgi:hypothetical protein